MDILKAYRQGLKTRKPVSISRAIALIFLAIILLGSLLLTLPVSSRSGESAGFLTALFTATSATCVTGLVMGDTWEMWSPLGQGLILMMIEIGGLGFMSAAFLAYTTLRKRFSMNQQMLMAESIGIGNMGDVYTLQRAMLIRALTVEGAGALILTLRFLREYDFGTSVKLGVFHAVSAFCNAGFDILGFRKPGSSVGTCQEDPIVLLTLSALVILGGLGFMVWDEVLRGRKVRRWSVYTRLVLITSGVLLAGGTLLFCLLEWQNPRTLGALQPGYRVLGAFFQSVTLRTAGFAGLDQGMLTPGGKAVSIALMLIGGSSGSTAGGLKTVTLVVLLLFVWNRVRGRQYVSVFHRSISNEHVLNAVTIFLLMVLLVLAATVLICATSPIAFDEAVFEATSAIGTVGLTTGVTVKLSLPAKLMIILLMYFGRVGLLTISFGFLKKKAAGEKYKYANTDLLIG